MTPRLYRPFLIAGLMVLLTNLSSSVADELVNAGIATGDKVTEAPSYFAALQRAANDAINELKQTSSIQNFLPGSKFKNLKIQSIFETIAPDDCLHQVSLYSIQMKLLNGCTNSNKDYLYSIVISNFTSTTEVTNIVFPYGFNFIGPEPDTALDDHTLQYADSGTAQKQWETTKTLLKLAFLNWYFNKIATPDVSDNKIAYNLFGGMYDKLDRACSKVPDMQTHCDLLKGEVTQKLHELRNRLEHSN